MTLKGIVDIHIHGGPSLAPRKMLDHEIALAAAQAGMRAIVLKSHEGSTVERAALAEAYAEHRVKVYGGLVLNNFIGGLNPFAVQAAIQMGAKIVWMPTFTALSHMQHELEKGYLSPALSVVCHQSKGIRILDTAGQLVPEVYDILELLAEAKVTLSLGHLALDESKALVTAARERGVEKIILSHPEKWLTLVPLPEQQWFVKQGVFIERCVVNLIREEISWPRLAQEIRETGLEQNLISTDLGQKNSVTPCEGLELALTKLQEVGFSTSEVEQLMALTPASLIE
jgi:hypothetical protein